MESYLEYKVSVKLMALRVKVNTSKLMLKNQAVVGEYAAKKGITAAICHFKWNRQLLNLKLAWRGTGG